MNPLLLQIIGRALILAPEIMALMESDKNLTIEDLWPTPLAVHKQRIREREGIDEPPK